MNKTNKKAIEILKAKMSLEEREMFINNMYMHTIPVTISSFLLGSFVYSLSKEGNFYWLNIYSRFTDEELDTKIDVK